MDFSTVTVFLVGNIPASFHAYDLRAFFSHFTEKKGFVCFHFRHRPEYLSATGDDGKEKEKEGNVGARAVADAEGGRKKARTVCCVVAVRRGMEREFVRLYRGKNWSGLTGESLRRRVRLREIRPESGMLSDKRCCYGVN